MTNLDSESSLHAIQQLRAERDQIRAELKQVKAALQTLNIADEQALELLTQENAMLRCRLQELEEADELPRQGFSGGGYT